MGIQHRDHSILYALVCEKELSYKGKNKENLDLLSRIIYLTLWHDQLLQFSLTTADQGHTILYHLLSYYLPLSRTLQFHFL